jgi:SAM-dependent methyltransferase
MRIYSDLASWFHLLTHPSDYESEARFVADVIESTVEGEARTLLELGSGGGNNASHLKRRFRCTLTDLSHEMLAVSRSLNPECEHVHGDMRDLRLGRTFDALLVHDAIVYMATEDDLRAAVTTAASHLRAGGVAVFLPDATLESFVPSTAHGGHDGDDGRRLRYLEWTHPVEPGHTSAYVDFVLVLLEPGREPEVVHERHSIGVFPEATWQRLLESAGLELVEPGIANPHADEQATFVVRRRAA